jgi:hypothetical protein
MDAHDGCHASRGRLGLYHWTLNESGASRRCRAYPLEESMTALQSPIHHPGRPRRTVLLVAVLAIVAAASIGSASLTVADHESTNLLTFAPVSGSSTPAASGSGTIEYHGGREPVSRWTSTFEFSGLAPGTAYVVVVQGRTGEDGSAAATAFSPICTVQSDAAGDGTCWDYEFGMRRIGVVQLRQGDGDGPVVLQATRAPDGPGEIRSLPNALSPAPTPPPGSPSPFFASPFPG